MKYYLKSINAWLIGTKKVNLSCFAILLAMVMISCQPPDPNVDKTGQDKLQTLETDYPINTTEIEVQDVLYIPIYADIYLNSQAPSSLLAATLSIRNTSFGDTLYVSRIDYFNTEGVLIEKFLDHTISIAPMNTLNYVIEKDGDSMKPGSNFIVELGGKRDRLKPLVQAVMVGEYRDIGFAFTTDAYSIDSKGNR